MQGSSKMDPQDDRQWLGLDWGQRGGLQGRECCIWVQLQRQLRARSLLPAEAIRRLESLNFAWEPQVAHHAAFYTCELCLYIVV